MERILLHRPRYVDYFITRSSAIKPLTAEGIMSCHFSLDNVILLGESAIGPSTRESKGTTEIAKLIFAVDEHTGGSLPDGFEWISAISRMITSFQALHETLYAK